MSFIVSFTVYRLGAASGGYRATVCVGLGDDRVAVGARAVATAVAPGAVVLAGFGVVPALIVEVYVAPGVTVKECGVTMALTVGAYVPAAATVKDGAGVAL